MFDIGFSELILLAVVALVVVGPKRLPVATRTFGTLMGRAQRYVSDVKSDIQRQMDLE
jgi:sec-independent protein translocase protein TatB